MYFPHDSRFDASGFGKNVIANRFSPRVASGDVPKWISVIGISQVFNKELSVKIDGEIAGDVCAVDVTRGLASVAKSPGFNT